MANDMRGFEHGARWCALTCWMALVSQAPASGQTPDEVRASIEYVQSLYDRETGGYRPAPDKPAELGSTSAALRTLRYLGVERISPRRDRTMEFIAQCFDRASGGFAAVPGGKPDVRTTAVGLMAVKEVGLVPDSFVAPASRYLTEHVQGFEDIRIAAAGYESVNAAAPNREPWIAVLREMQNPDGTFGRGPSQARDTGGAAVALLRLGAKLEQRSHIVQAIKSGQRPDGGFGRDAGASDLESTYRIMRLFYLLREKPDSAKLRGFIASCRNADGGYGVKPGEASGVGPSYFAAIILHWLRQIETGETP
jgi:prenyltransferase beta subunit